MYIEFWYKLAYNGNTENGIYRKYDLPKNCCTLLLKRMNGEYRKEESPMFHSVFHGRNRELETTKEW